MRPSHPHPPTHTHTHSHTWTSACAHTHTRVYTHLPTPTYIDKCADIPTHTHTHTLTHPHKHGQVRAHTHTSTHTHTHTHTVLYPCFSCSAFAVALLTPNRERILGTNLKLFDFDFQMSPCLENDLTFKIVSWSKLVLQSAGVPCRTDRRSWVWICGPFLLKSLAELQRS